MPSTFGKYLPKPKIHFSGLKIGRDTIGDKTDCKILERRKVKECKKVRRSEIEMNVYTSSHGPYILIRLQEKTPCS